MPGLRVAKADENDFETTRNFLQACEQFWDSRTRYSLREIESDWHRWDDDDPDKIELLKLRRELADEDGISEQRVDNRIVIYEYLKRKYKKCDCNWARVVIAGDVLIDNVCDPTEDHLSFYPGLEIFHVAPEQ